MCAFLSAPKCHVEPLSCRRRSAPFSALPNATWIRRHVAGDVRLYQCSQIPHGAAAMLPTMCALISAPECHVEPPSCRRRSAPFSALPNATWNRRHVAGSVPECHVELPSCRRRSAPFSAFPNASWSCRHVAGEVRPYQRSRLLCGAAVMLPAKCARRARLP